MFLHHFREGRITILLIVFGLLLVFFIPIFIFKLIRGEPIVQAEEEARDLSGRVAAVIFKWGAVLGITALLVWAVIDATR